MMGAASLQISTSFDIMHNNSIVNVTSSYILLYVYFLIAGRHSTEQADYATSDLSEVSVSN